MLIINDERRDNLKKKEALEKLIVGVTGASVVTIGLFFLYKPTDEDPFPISLSLTENFEGQIELDLDWATFDETSFKEPVIRINRTRQPVEGLTSLEAEISSETPFFNVQAKSEAKSYKTPSLKTAFTAYVSPVFNGYQKILNFEHLGEQINFTHAIKHTHTEQIDQKTLKVHLYNQNGELLQTITPQNIQLNDGILTHNVQLFTSPLVGQELIYILVSYELNGVSYTQFIRDFDNEPYTKTGSYHFEPIFLNGIFSLKKSSEATLTLNSYNIHGESLHLSVNGTKSISDYQLVSISPQSPSTEVIPYLSKVNKGIELDTLALGDYLIKINDNLLFTGENEGVLASWYGVTRNEKNKLFELKNVNGLTVLSVSQVDELPDSVYDIIIDAGHGGSDSGAVGGGLLEKDEALKVSKYMAEKFESYGLKVKMTRTGDEIEAEKGISDYETKPFVTNGRVDMVYTSKAKLVISNHLNAYRGTSVGSEVYSSISTSDEWASSIINQFKLIGRTVNNSDNGYRVSDGSYKRNVSCLELYSNACNSTSQNSDYLYMVRETGGALTNPSSLIHKNNKYSEAPSYGAESILMEYIYIDNASERAYWQENWEKLADAVIYGTLDYLNISY